MFTVTNNLFFHNYSSKCSIIHGIVSIEVFISFVQSLYGYFRHLALKFLRIHRCVHPEHVNQVCKESFFFPVLLLVGNTVKFPKGTYFARFCSFCIYGANMKSTLDLQRYHRPK